MAQVTPKTAAFLLGSGDISVGDSEGTLVSLGAANGIKFEEKWEEIKMDIDNAGEHLLGIKNHEAKASGSFLELDLEKIADLRGGIDTYSTVAAAIVEDYDQTVASGDWSFNTFIECEFQNGDGSILQIDAQGYVDVSGSVDLALVHGTDYEMVCVNGKWGIIVKDSVTVTTEAQILTISYDYTPAATKKLSSGGKTTVSAKVVQIKHTTSDGKEFKVVLYAAKNSEGMTFDFPSDNADKAMEVPFTFTGKCDNDRTVGDQLFRIEDTRVY